MNTNEHVDEAIEVLQQLGLKEYEARCFVGLTRLHTGTAKQLSEVTEVPRTRVYDAVRVLEAQGLVEVQHSSPQRFRAVSLEEAIETLRDQHESRVDRLRHALDTVDIVEETDDSPAQQVWGLTGQDAIENRTNQLIESSSEEIVLVVGNESLLTEALIDTLDEVEDGADLIVGALTEPLQDRVRETVPHATTFVSGLSWLQGTGKNADGTNIGRLLLADRSKILVSTITPRTKEEQAIFGTGFSNGLVVVARRIMAQGLLPTRDPSGE